MPNTEIVTTTNELINAYAAQELAKLQSRFPGLQEDQRVKDLFEDPTTGNVRIRNPEGDFDPIEYNLYGEIDHDVQAIKNPEPLASGRAVGMYFLAGEILPR